MAPVVTRSREAEWDALLPRDVVHSQRSTTSSRLPGKSIEGTVHRDAHRVVDCTGCGGKRFESSHPHAPRWLAGVLVDCTGAALGGA